MKPAKPKLSPSAADPIAYLQARAVEDTHGCWLWRLAVNSAGHPVATIDGKFSRLVRRWAWDRLHSRQSRLREADRVLMSCASDRCVNPAHFIRSKPADVNAAIAARGGFSTPARRAAARRSGAATSPIADADIPVIRARAAVETLAAIAADYGVHISTVSRICRHESRPDPGNPYLQLMR